MINVQETKLTLLIFSIPLFLKNTTVLKQKMSFIKKKEWNTVGLIKPIIIRDKII